MVTLLSSDGRGWRGLHARLCRIAPGRTQVAGAPWHRVSLHFGTAVNADCRCDGRHLRHVQSHGNADIVPAGLGGEWEDDAVCTILRLHLDPALLREAAETIGRDPGKVEVTPQFQVRDSRIASIGWALKGELEADTASDALFAECLARALAVRLVEGPRGACAESGARRQTLSARQMRRLQAFIGQNLSGPLGLKDLAAVLNIIVSHLSTLFRQTAGVSLHQYVIRRRIEYAEMLLRQGRMAVSEVAVASGFADQSHLSRCMRRVLGVSPGTIVRLTA
jgi:AraC family transcriptional regulator